MTFCEIWKEQWDAARQIENEFGRLRINHADSICLW
jgi:hypothetical protein